MAINFKTKAINFAMQKLVVSVNSSKFQVNLRKKSIFPEKNIMDSLRLGVSFIGKISNFNIFNKDLKKNQINFLKSLTAAYSLLKIPSTLEKPDSSLAQDIKSNLYISITPNSVKSLEKIKFTITCDFFIVSTFYNAIESYGPSRFLIDLIEQWDSNENYLTRAYELILKLLIEPNFYRIIDESFIKVLGYYLNSLSFTDREHFFLF